jgi:hypothetical protein
MLAANAGTTAITDQTLAPSTRTSQRESNMSRTVPAMPSEAGSPAVEVATVNPGTHQHTPIILGIAGVFSVGVIFAGFRIWRRRAHSASSEVSLITESIDRRKN